MGTKIFGTRSELVQIEFRQNTNTIVLEPNPGTYTATTTLQLPPFLPGAPASSVLVDEVSTQTLSGKTINAASNTLSNISNASIAAAAAIDFSKLAALASGNILVGSVSNVATSVAMTGDVTISNAGVTAIASGVIVNADINASAAIDASKIADGSVSSTEFQYLGGVTSDIQTQLGNKQPIDADLTALAGVSATGLLARTGAGTAEARTVTGTANRITVSNGDGVSGNPTLDIGTDVVTLTGTQALTNKTIQEGLVDNFLDVNEETAPATPAAGKVRVYAKTDKKVYRKGSDGIESQLGGASGSSGVNYLVSSLKAWDFEDGTITGWGTYADAAGTSPVDGTGGSPAITFTASATSPLRGVYNGLLTKDAANRQGQGVSVDFTLDAADKSKPFSVVIDTETSANYTGSSGTEYARIFVYDVTNASLLPGYIEVPVGSGPARGFFLATTSTSYRLIFHVAGTGASAWTLKLDNVQVGPQDILFGLAGHEAISYTPTLEGGFTNTIAYAKYSRVGKRILIESRIDVTGVGSGADVTFSLPTGLTFNLGSGTNEVGSGVFTDVSVPTSHSVQLTSSSGSSSKCGFVLTSNQNNILQGNELASGDVLFVSISFEVNEWSANLQMADRSVEEFAFNTSTSTTTDDTTSFGYGAQGAQIQNVTVAMGRRVRFQQPFLPTDYPVLELSNDRVIWRAITGLGYFEASGNSRVTPFTSQNGVTYGIGIADASTDPRDLDVSIGQYAHPSGATFGSAGTAWSVGAGSLYWRVRKVSGGAAVGFPVSARNIVGHLPTSSTDVVPTGFVGELLSSTLTRGANIGLTTGVAANVTSISLTPGIWDVTGIYKVQFAATTSVSQILANITNTSGALDQVYDGNYVLEKYNSEVVNDDPAYPLGVTRVVVSTTTTYYLVGRCSFSVSTASHYGTIRATRVG